MFNTTEQTNQPDPAPVPEQPQQKFAFAPRRKRFNFSKVPLVAQVTGLLSLLVIGAGLLTASQLSQTTQDLQSQAATGDVLLEFNQPNSTFEYNQEKSFFIVATPSNANMKISAAIIRIRNENFDVAEVTSIAPVANVLPVVLKPFAVEARNTSLVQHAVTLGAEPLKPISGKKNLVEVKIKAKAKAGKAVIEIAQNSEIAAFDNASNVVKKYDLQNAQKQYLVVDVKAPTPPSTSDICVNKTAAKVVGNQRTPLAANATVKPGDTIEYTITAQTRQDTTTIAFDDRFPTAVLQYVANSARLDGTAVTVDPTQISKNILITQKDVAAANRGKQTKLTYQVTVKAGTEGMEFFNHATVKLNNNNQMSDTCEINLGVERATPASPSPSPSTSPTPSPSVSPSPQATHLNVGFRVQAVTKVGVSTPAEVILRYKKKNSSEIVKKVYNGTFTIREPEPQGSTPGVFLPDEPILVNDINFAEVDAVPNNSSTNPGIEVFVKTPTTLRKRLGILRFSGNPPANLSGMFTTDAQVLMVGDFDRSQGQENVFRITDINRMINHYVQINNPVNNQNREFDVNYDGVFNPLDIAVIMQNYSKISIEGDKP